MVWKLICDCRNHAETKINTQNEFNEIKAFFENKEVFQEVTPLVPFYTWKSGDRKVEWFATKWIKCRVCGCLWEIQFPDFPAKGFVRKFPSGRYQPKQMFDRE